MSPQPAMGPKAFEIEKRDTALPMPCDISTNLETDVEDMMTDQLP